VCTAAGRPIVDDAINQTSDNSCVETSDRLFEHLQYRNGVSYHCNGNLSNLAWIFGYLDVASFSIASRDVIAYRPNMFIQ